MLLKELLRTVIPTFVTCLTLLSNKITRFTSNTLDGARLLKEVSFD